MERLNRDASVIDSKEDIILVGTGTEIGKTYTASCLVKELREKSIEAGYFKPVISGGIGDASQVCQETGLLEGKQIDGRPLRASDLVGQSFEHAYSPHLASRLEGKTVDLQKIEKRFRRIRPLFDMVVIEGCGGLFCPIHIYDSEQAPYSADIKERALVLKDVLELFSGRYILVCPAGLGCLNDAVLTCKYAREGKIKISEIILNKFQPGNPIHEDNRAFLKSWLGLPVSTLEQEESE